MITIIQAGLNDIPLIRDMARATWMATYPDIIGMQQVEYMLDRFYSTTTLSNQINVSTHVFLIAVVDKQPIAFAAYSLVDLTGTYKLHKLYTLPSAQKTGAGRALIDYIANNIRSLGGKRLVLNVNRHNAVAIRFYEHYGFSCSYEEDIDIGNGYFMNDYVYTLPIT